MNWTEPALILDISPLGEGNARVTVLAETQGVYSGFIRGIRSKQNQSILHRGNLVQADWNARLDEQLGHFRLDVITPYGTRAVFQRQELESINLISAMVLTCLHERQSFRPIYEASLVLLENLSNTDVFIPLYQKWELGLLSTLGFGLDFSRCADTGQTTDLTHVSPKTGKAICKTSAAPYKSRLLLLPKHLLVESEKRDKTDQIQGFKVSGFFIEKWILRPKGKELPPARARFLDRIQKMDRI